MRTCSPPNYLCSLFRCVNIPHTFLPYLDFSTLSTVESIDDSSGRETNSASRRHHRRGHPTRRKQHGNHGNELRRVVRVEYQKDTWDVASTGKIDRPYFIVLIVTLFILRLFT